MAQVKVVFFASLRDKVGCGEMAVDADTLGQLQAYLQQAFDAEQASALWADNVRIAVNQELVEAEVDLRDGDEVAFLPPVTGG